MSIQNEIWIAYAGNQLTCRVSVDHSSSDSVFQVVIAGEMDSKTAFITDMIIAMMRSFPCKRMAIDVKFLLFRDGQSINDSAIECVLSLVSATALIKISTELIMDDLFLLDILESKLHKRPGYSTLTICSGS